MFVGDVKFVNEEKTEEKIEEKTEEKTEEKAVVKRNESRFAVLNDEDLDKIAKARLSVHTESQTKWAANLFKGI